MGAREGCSSSSGVVLVGVDGFVCGFRVLGLGPNDLWVWGLQNSEAPLWESFFDQYLNV